MPITIGKIELFCSLLFFSPTSLQRAKNACFSLIFPEKSAFRNGFELRRSDVKKDLFFNIFRRRSVESSSDNFRFFPTNTVSFDIYQKTRNQLYLRVPWVRIPPTPPENSVCKRFLPFAGFFFLLHLWDFSVSSLLKIDSSLLNFLRFELWICSWRILSKAIRRRSYEITSNAPLRPFTIASADDSLEL